MTLNGEMALILRYGQFTITIFSSKRLQRDRDAHGINIL